MPLLDAFGREIQKPDPMAEELTLHADAWANAQTGMGVWGLDKTRGASYLPVWRVLDQELTSLMNGSDLARKVVSKRAEEKWRRGFALEAKNVNETEREKLREYATNNLNLETNFLEGERWGRCYGGSLLIMGIDDGRFPWEPLDEDNIRSFDSLSLVDRRYSYVQSQYAAMGTTSKYGSAQIYLISNAVAGYGWDAYGAQKIEPKSADNLIKQGAQVVLVHESRVIRFDGNAADIVTRQNLAGWSWSVLQVVYDQLRQFDESFNSAVYLLADASQGVYKLQGLLRAISSGNRGSLSARLQLIEQSRSVLRAIALDAGGADGKNAEDFTRVPTPFGGIPELLDKLMLRFAAAADMPATELFGRAPAGLNATGESDTRKWYDTIASEQENQLGPKLKRVFKLLAKARKGPLRGRDVSWTIKFHPLWAPTDKELSETRKNDADRDGAYIDRGVVKPEEVAVGLSDVYPNLDIKGREEALKAGLVFDPYKNEPEPVISTGIAGQTEGEPLSSKSPVPLMGTSGTQITRGALPAVGALEQTEAAAEGSQAPVAGSPARKPAKGGTDAPNTQMEQAKKTAAHDKEKAAKEVPSKGQAAEAEEGKREDGVSDLPADFGTEVPLQGSSCSDCRFLHMVRHEPSMNPSSPQFPTCTNETFIRWQSKRVGYVPEDGEGIRIPAVDDDPRRYCCSAWQAAPGVFTDSRDRALVAQAKTMLAARADAQHALAVFLALLSDYRELLRQDGDSEAKRVYQQLTEDYPTRLLGWVLAAHWKGPVELPLDQIDSSGRDKWTATRDGKLESFKDKIAEGVRKPAILVKVPDNPKYIIVDGHHRFLGHEALGLPLLAYVSEMHVSRGPWDTLHDAQRGGRSGPSGPSSAHPAHWQNANAPATPAPNTGPSGQ